MKKPKQVEEREFPLGTVFNPHVVKAGYRVAFEYDTGSYFHVELKPDGGLRVQTSGRITDLILTEHHVQNDLTLRPRRWSYETMRYEPFYTDEEADRK